MEGYCGKLENGKWVCHICNPITHHFRDEYNYGVHIKGSTHKKKIGEEVKSKKEILNNELEEARDRIRYLEKQLEEARLEIKELKLEKQIEERIRKEQPKHIVEPAMCIPHNEIVKPARIKKKDIGNPIKYLTEIYPNPINIFQEIHNWKNGKDTGINEILDNVTDIKSEIIKVIEYFKGSFFYINEEESYAHDGREWNRLYDNALLDQCFMFIINHLTALYKEKTNASINAKEVYIETLIQIKKINSL
jgi:hypothetical protein